MMNIIMEQCAQGIHEHDIHHRESLNAQNSLLAIEKGTKDLEPAIRSAVLSLASTIQRMEAEGRGSYDAPLSGLVEPLQEEEIRKGRQHDKESNQSTCKHLPVSLSVLILRQTALNLAIAAGRLDIVSLMVGSFEDEEIRIVHPIQGEGTCTDVNAHVERLYGCAARHLGWNPYFTTLDTDAVLEAAEREHQVLGCLLSRRGVFGGRRAFPDGSEPRLRLPVNLVTSSLSCATGVTSLNALHRACFYNRLPIVRYLVEVCGMGVDEPTMYGSSLGRSLFVFLYPIHFAAIAATWTGDLSILRYLIEERKCNKEARVFVHQDDGSGRHTALMSCITSPAQTALHLVCTHKEWISPSPRCAPKWALLGAAHGPRLYAKLVTRYLLRVGLDGLAETKSCNTPFSLAVTSAKKRSNDKFNAHYHAYLSARGHGIPQLAFLPPEVHAKEFEWSLSLVKMFLSRCPHACSLLHSYPLSDVGLAHGDGIVIRACPWRMSALMPAISEEEMDALRDKQPTELLELLLSHGAAPLSREESARLLDFTTRGHCQLMIDHGIDLVASTPQLHEEPTHLHRAVKKDRADIVRMLLDNGVDPNQIDPSTGRTALFFATSPEVVQALTSRGANPRWRDFKGRTVLHAIGVANTNGGGLGPTSPSGHTLCALVAAGCDLHASDGGRRAMTPLHVWASWRDVCFLNALTPNVFKSVMDLNVRDAFGFTPLHMAALWSLSALKRLLEISKLIDMEQGKRTGFSPENASTNVCFLVNSQTTKPCDQWILGDTDVTGSPTGIIDSDSEYFSNSVHGALPNPSDFFTWNAAGSVKEWLASTAKLPVHLSQKPPIAAGSTPLHAAASWGNLLSCCALLEQDVCDPNLRDTNGHTPLDVALMRGHTEIAASILSCPRAKCPRTAPT